MTIKNEVLIRVYIVLAMIVLTGILIFGKAFWIQFKEGEKWRKQGETKYVDYYPVEAERGNILTEDGNLLATSLPFFDIHLDLDPSVVSDEDFYANVDSLAYCLATYVDDTYTVGGMRERLLEARDFGNRYIPIKKHASYLEKERIASFPLFNLGRYRGGFIVERKADRDRPFGILASRTIGYVREWEDGKVRKFGLEGYFNDVLAGKEGQRLMMRLSGGQLIPVNDLTEVEPVTGDDIITTLDINIQDIAHEALLRALQYHQADNGTAVVMEVKTGAIKAISNIGRVEQEGGKIAWWETYNHAVGTAIEPGSTYKLASILALLEDGYIRLQDSIPLNQGKAQFYEEVMEDATFHTLDSTTVKHAFEISSNVGIAKMVQKFYGRGESSLKGAKPEQFIKRLRQFNLHLRTGIEIEGESTPYIKDPENPDDHWSGTTLPWMSIGYELTITPLQLLTFYNAVANDGQMMKPYLVSEIQRFGETIEYIKPVAMKRKIASPSAIRKAKFLLESVVENGTAKKLKSSRYRFAGKTGTAQINYQKINKNRDNLKYRASFAGYFPAEEPVYSCIVVITNPREHGIYGGEVAGPVFREIADACFTSKIELQQAVNEGPRPVLSTEELPNWDAGHREDVQMVLRYLNLPYKENPDAHWTVISAEADTLNLRKRVVYKDQVPNVVGMGLRDALYILENLGLQVRINGVGKVRRQSIIPGTPVKGQTINLSLR